MITGAHIGERFVTLFEAMALKIYSVVQPHFPIGIGTFFHLLFLRKSDTDKGIKRSWSDILNVALISLTIGVVIQYIVIGYYEYKGTEPKEGVLIAFGVTLSALGFSGIVWFVNFFKRKSEKAADAAIDKYSGKKKTGMTSYSSSGGDESEHYDEYDR